MSVLSNRDIIIERVKAYGQELIDRAEEIVSSAEHVTDFTIVLPIRHDEVPTIRVEETLISKIVYGDWELK